MDQWVHLFPYKRPHICLFVEPHRLHGFWGLIQEVQRHQIGARQGVLILALLNINPINVVDPSQKEVGVAGYRLASSPSRPPILTRRRWGSVFTCRPSHRECARLRPVVIFFAVTSRATALPISTAGTYEPTGKTKIGKLANIR